MFFSFFYTFQFNLLERHKTPWWANQSALARECSSTIRTHGRIKTLCPWNRLTVCLNCCGAFSLPRMSGPPRTGRSRRTSDPPEMAWKGLIRSTSDTLLTFNHLSPGDKVSPTHQPIKCSSTEYLATFTHFRSHTRIIGKGNLCDFATIFSRLTARSCTGQRGNL